MMRLVVLAAVTLALVVAEPAAFERDLGPLSVKLAAGEGAAGAPAREEDVSMRSVLISNRIINFLEGHRDGMTNPYVNPEVGPIVVGTPGLILFRLRTILNDLLVNGVNDWAIQSLVFSLLRMNLNFHIDLPAIRAMAAYTAEARLGYFITHRASGIATVAARGLSVDGYMQMTVSGGKLQASEMKMDIKMDDTNINLTEVTGVGVIDFVLSWVIQNVSSDIIQDSMGEISEAISEAVFDIVNEVLGNFTLEDLLG